MGVGQEEGRTEWGLDRREAEQNGVWTGGRQNRMGVGQEGGRTEWGLDRREGRIRENRSETGQRQHVRVCMQAVLQRRPIFFGSGSR